MLKTAVLVFLISFGSAAFACPPRQGEKELSFSQLMINFGKYLRKADALALKGLDFPEEVSPADLEEARSGIVVSLSCAETSFGPNPLMPPRLKNMPPEEAKAYVIRMQSFMRTFKILLLTYQQNFSELRPQDKSASYRQVYETSKKIQEWASTAHAYL